jgi:hypothetical protein
VSDEIDGMRPRGRPLGQLPSEPTPQRHDKLTFLMPWNQSARFRQICNEHNMSASGELRKMLKRWLDEYDVQQESTQ